MPTEEPLNKNYLQNHIFKFQIEKMPNVSYFGNKVNIPGISTQPVDVPSQLTSMPFAGTRVNYHNLVVHFVVDEDLTNWLEVHDWITGESLSESYDQYKKLRSRVAGLTAKAGVPKSNACLTIYGSNFEPKYKVDFMDIFPLELGEIPFDATINNTSFIEVSVVFDYTLYRINRV